MGLDNKYTWVAVGLVVVCAISSLVYYMMKNRGSQDVVYEEPDLPPAQLPVVYKPATKPKTTTKPKASSTAAAVVPVQVPVPVPFTVPMHVVPSWNYRKIWEPRWDNHRWDNRWDDRARKDFIGKPWGNHDKEPRKDIIERELDAAFRRGRPMR